MKKRIVYRYDHDLELYLLFQQKINKSREGKWTEKDQECFSDAVQEIFGERYYYPDIDKSET